MSTPIREGTMAYWIQGYDEAYDVWRPLYYHHGKFAERDAKRDLSRILAADIYELEAQCIAEYDDFKIVPLELGPQQRPDAPRKTRSYGAQRPSAASPAKTKVKSAKGSAKGKKKGKKDAKRK